LIQINTGEGKSVVLGITALIFSLLGFYVDVICYSKYLSKRDAKSMEFF
jgi:preprotein translocase subunit SecA